MRAKSILYMKKSQPAEIGTWRIAGQTGKTQGILKLHLSGGPDSYYFIHSTHLLNERG